MTSKLKNKKTDHNRHCFRQTNRFIKPNRSIKSALPTKKKTTNRKADTKPLNLQPQRKLLEGT